PTEIQALTIPAILSTKDARHILCAAETGSGKTLAYLVPTIHALKQKEQQQKNSNKRRLDRPRAIVLVPTRELVSQVLQTCKSLAHTVKFRSLALDGKTPRHRLVKDLERPVDVLITTPTTLRGYVADHTLSLSDVQFLIVDEADSLFDAGWGDDVQYVMKKIPRDRQECKTVVVSATLPRSVHRTLDDLFGQEGMLKITTPSLHRALPNLKQSFVDLQRFNGNRQLALLDVLKKNIKDEKTLVFCNTKHSAQLLQQWLASKEVDVFTLHKDVDRKQTLGLFSGEIQPEALEEEEAKKKNYNVLISTDIASRGIDTTFVDHVVLYDFPASMIDYLHRVGRTARAGRTGKATSLIGRKDRMIADRIKRSI
ncbi:P-loop containing nucleoside triphosphate hydrolase protein, partial [Phascolomyces articulosus]